MLHDVEITGAGRVQLPAYGIADAEHRVEKEILARLTHASVSIVAVERPAGSARIVEEFSVGYRVRCNVRVETDSRDAAASAAYRRSREALAGTRYVHTAWSANDAASAPGLSSD